MGGCWGLGGRGGGVVGWAVVSGDSGGSDLNLERGITGLGVNLQVFLSPSQRLVSHEGVRRLVSSSAQLETVPIRVSGGVEVRTEELEAEASLSARALAACTTIPPHHTAIDQINALWRVGCVTASTDGYY